MIVDVAVTAVLLVVLAIPMMDKLKVDDVVGAGRSAYDGRRGCGGRGRAWGSGRPTASLNA